MNIWPSINLSNKLIISQMNNTQIKKPYYKKIPLKYRSIRGVVYRPSRPRTVSIHNRNITYTNPKTCPDV